MRQKSVYFFKEVNRSLCEPVRFEIQAEASIKMAVFWVTALFSLVEVYRRFKGACCLYHQGDGVLDDHLGDGDSSTSETSVNF
jgi:hypothetical protein